MAPKKTAAEIDEIDEMTAALSLSAEIEEMNMNREGEAGATIAYELGLKIRKAFDSGAFGASVQGGVSDRTAQIIAAFLPTAEALSGECRTNGGPVGPRVPETTLGKPAYDSAGRITAKP